MKLRRLFQVTAAMFAIICAIALFAVGVATILPFFFQFELPGFLNDLTNGYSNAVNHLGDTFEFLKGLSEKEGHVGELIFVGVTFGAPSFLLLISALVLFSKPRSKSQIGHKFANILAILGAIIFAVIFVLEAKTIFGDERGIAWMIGAGFGGAMIVFLNFIALSAKGGKPKAEAQPVPAEGEQPQNAEPDAPLQEVVEPTEPQTDDVAVAIEAPQQQKIEMETETATVLQQPTSEPQPAPATAPEIQPQVTQTPQEPQPIVQQPVEEPQKQEDLPETDFLPYETATVNDVIEHTYGKKLENLSDAHMKKIHTLRTLYDTHTITKEEYLALLNAYLKEEQ